MNQKFILWAGFLLLLILIVCCIWQHAGEIQEQVSANATTLSTQKPAKEMSLLNSGDDQTLPDSVKLAKLLVERTITFKTNTAQLDENGYRVLDQVYRILKSHENLKLLIVGHTDAAGNETYNRELSKRRAQAVANYLKQKGLTGATFEIIGKGSSEPIASNNTQQGRQKNRRVEILIKGE